MDTKDLIERVLTRTVSEVIDLEDLRAKLLSGRQLRVKLGIDPTSANIHIGRAVTLWKLREFQDLGHKVVFIVGDFTGLIGDTSDKESERPMLTEEIVAENLKSYFEQAYKILDRELTEVSYNSTWLKPLGFADIGKLADAFGLHEFSARENIAKRLSAGKRVSLRELLYPLMQGYDSIAVRADVELGGTDQRFNLLAGRTLQKQAGQEAQSVMTMELLEGTDGRKMSSSWGNVINLMDSARDMVFKLMGVPDELVKKYFIFTTRLSLEKIEEILLETPHPRDLKMRLALEVAALYHSRGEAEAAVETWKLEVSEKQLPSDIGLVEIAAGEYDLASLVVASGLVSSKGEARRLALQDGVKIDGELVREGVFVFPLGKQVLLQVGKKNFVYLQ